MPGVLVSKQQPTRSFVLAIDFACVLHINKLWDGFGVLFEESLGVSWRGGRSANRCVWVGFERACLASRCVLQVPESNEMDKVFPRNAFPTMQSGGRELSLGLLWRVVHAKQGFRDQATGSFVAACVLCTLEGRVWLMKGASCSGMVGNAIRKWNCV